MAQQRSDKALASTWDIVIANGIVKTGLGLGAGVIASVVFFRRRSFPVFLGAGFGAGKAWAEGDAYFRTQATPEAGKRQVNTVAARTPAAAGSTVAGTVGIAVEGTAGIAEDGTAAGSAVAGSALAAATYRSGPAALAGSSRSVVAGVNSVLRSSLVAIPCRTCRV